MQVFLPSILRIILVGIDFYSLQGKTKFDMKTNKAMAESLT